MRRGDSHPSRGAQVRTRTLELVKFLTLMAALTCAVCAQARPTRVLAAGWDDGLTVGSSTIIARASEITIYGSTGSGTSVAPDLDALGAYEVIGSQSLAGLVVAGRKASAGRLEHWTNTGSGWVMTSAMTVPGADFTGVAMLGPCLYVLDCVSNSILFGVWDPTASLGALNLGIYTTATEFTYLQESRTLLMYSLKPADIPTLAVPGLFLFTQFETLVSKGGKLLTDGASGLTMQEFVYAPLPVIEGAVVVEGSAKAGDAVVTVAAKAQRAFEILNSFGAVIGSGAGSPQGDDVQVPLAESLVLGGSYTVRVIGQPWGSPFVALQRSGFPEQFDDGTQFERITAVPTDYSVGNAGFGFTVPVLRPAFAGPQRTYFGAMTLGLARTPIAPFNNGQGINELLLASYWVGAIGEIGLNARQGHVRMNFGIPSDPSWHGLVLLGQFIVFDNTGFRLSEVVGWQIQAP
jgi:hypothetical protein